MTQRNRPIHAARLIGAAAVLAAVIGNLARDSQDAVGLLWTPWDIVGG
jgi:hypothetical protein